MTDFTVHILQNNAMVPLCKTVDKTAIYAFNSDNNMIYRTYDGVNWQNTGVTIYRDISPSSYVAIYPRYFTETESDEVLIADSGAGRIYGSTSSAHWISASGGVTTINIAGTFGSDICGTKDCLYAIKKYTDVWIVTKYGRDGSIQNLYADGKDGTFPFLKIAASSSYVIICNTKYKQTYVYDKHGNHINTSGYIGDVKLCFEKNGKTIVIADQYVDSVEFQMVVYEFKNNSFNELHRIRHDMATGFGRSHSIRSRYINNELHNKLYFTVEYYTGSSASYSIYGIDINTYEIGYAYGGYYIGMLFDVGAGQVIGYGDGGTVLPVIGYHVYYTEEGGQAWRRQSEYFEGHPIDLLSLENGNLIGKVGDFNATGQKPRGVLCRFNVKDSGVKIFIDGEKKDLRAYNLTNPDVIRQNKIHVINAAGEHVVLYDSAIPEPNKKHLVFYNGKEVRYVYSL